MRRFVDLTDEQLGSYLERNVEALRAAAAWHGSEVVIAGHAMPGPVIAGRALGPGGYIAKVHGSDIEYAIRGQDRYLQLAREGLGGARSVVGGSRDVLSGAGSWCRRSRDAVRVVAPGVDTDGVPATLARGPRCWETAELLDVDPYTVRGRAASLDEQVADAIARRDAAAIDALAGSYDQEVPDPDASAVLRRLAGARTVRSSATSAS